ncbi:MAG: hypothetical protein LBC73_01105 [Oscillospiraceae bacterium]|jgi:hypothetical protein|nr:hypothetical protein [Oscillospiraceae bacterium]
MKYKYYCQYQAEDYAKSILPVPKDYPLQKGLPKDYSKKFAKLCEFAKRIYMDMARNPENYGLILVELDTNDFEQIRNGFYSLRRFPDTIIALFQSGKLKNNQLIVQADEFHKLIKKNRGKTAASVSKYELILSCLSDFGFTFSDFNGKPYGKNVKEFTVEFPSDLELINTIKDYVICWETFTYNEGYIKIVHTWEYRQYDYFDYKVTSNPEEIKMKQWVIDDRVKYVSTPKLQEFAIAFYDYSLKYKDINFDGDFNLKTKRIARINQYGCDMFGRPVFKLSIKLPLPEKSMDAILKCPETIQKQFKQDTSGGCYKFKEGIKCSHMLKWTINGNAHTGCPMKCFLFDNFDQKLIPHYWQLLESQYGLK